MAHVFKISSFGLKLIKAYEGFRPVETTLVSGQRVIGYGHRFQDTEEPAISRKRAEDLLKADLEAYEDIVNANVFAPLTQSQFDALVSLSFNIGPQAFLSSSVLHALNNGRPLAAAAGFDEWRKSVIEGKTYVVDALVRRRTAEKSLFLRATEGVVTAPRNELPPRQDHSLQAFAANVDIFDKADAQIAGIVEQTPYAAKPIPTRRREDGPAGTMEHSEKLAQTLAETQVQTARAEDVLDTAQRDALEPHHSDIEDTNQIIDLVTEVKREAPAPIQAPIQAPVHKKLSPIALAAEEVSERLDRLIADIPDSTDNPAPQKSDANAVEEVSEVSGASGRDHHAGYEQKEQSQGIADVIANIKAANEGTRDDYRRPANNSNVAHTRSPDSYIQQSEKGAVDTPRREGFLAYWVAFTMGLCMLLYAASRWFLTPKNVKLPSSDMQAFITPAIALIGAMMVLGTLYYLAKTFMRRA